MIVFNSRFSTLIYYHHYINVHMYIKYINILRIDSQQMTF